jgi:hypothetical protein
MAKRVANNVKVEVRAVDGEWQDISDHVEAVALEAAVGELYHCTLTLQCDENTLRVTNMGDWLRNEV